VVSESFISFAIDQCYFRHESDDAPLWRGMANPCWVNLTDPTVVALARSFAPSYLRLGGTAADNVSYAITYPCVGGICRGHQSDPIAIPHGVLTANTWDELNHFVEAAGWEMIFGLNTLSGWDIDSNHSWDSTNAAELMRYTVDKAYPVVGWELGDEPDADDKGEAYIYPNISISHFSVLFDTASSIYSSIGSGTRASPWIIGPDVTHFGLQNGYLSHFLGGLSPPGVDVVTWHHYYQGASGTVNPTDYMDPVFLNDYPALASLAQQTFEKYDRPRKQLWMGETGGAGVEVNGSDTILGNFRAIFWWLDKLGAAAATGHSVVVRQQFQYLVVPVKGGGARVTPEFWVAQLWRKVMGTHVLAVTGDRTGVLRVYAHADASLHTVGVLAINLGNVTATATIDIGASVTEHDEFRVTAYPEPTNLEATDAALNGERLSLSPSGTLPDLVPITVSGAQLTVGPRSVTFAIFQDAWPGAGG